jgi:hypothetical protein
MTQKVVAMWLDFLRSGINWPETLSNSEKVVKIAAVVIGGVWTYLKFIRGRIYRPRLKPSVSGRIVIVGGQPYLVVSLGMENVGSSKVDISQRGTGLRVFSPELTPNATPPSQVGWMHLGTFSVFEKHGWIETGECVQDELLISLPLVASAFKLEFRVVAKGIEWQSRAIVESDGTAGRKISARPS